LSKLKALASQTMVYGVSTILGRLLNFALIPIFTHLLDEPKDMGYVNSLYGYVALLNVLCAMGMETTFFFYANKADEKKAFNNAFTIILGASGIISLFVLLGAGAIDSFQQTGNPWYYRIIAGMLLFDALAILPFARMRNQGKARKFALLKVLNIVVNVGFNLIFYYGYTHVTPGGDLSVIFNPDEKVLYIFLSNLIASFVTLLLVVKEYKGVKLERDGKALNELIKYAWPLVIVGLAAWVNENMDKSIMEKLLPGTTEEGYSKTGIYGAVYKLSIAMALVVQAFKFAAEPFFFGIQKDKDAKETYALVLKWFVIAECLVFLGVALNLELILHILDERYRIGKAVVPIVLLGQLFLGIYYNLSIWYKLTEQTVWGLYMSLAGAAVTIVLLFTLVPNIGYIGAAWATLASFFTMMMISFAVGKKHFPVPYEYRKISLYIGLAIVFWLIFNGAGLQGLAQELFIANTLIIIFIAFVWAVEKPRKLLLLRK
jgi:O-antigen/teichoic acid export membrane protein